jgi:hypothetical protein
VIDFDLLENSDILQCKDSKNKTTYFQVAIEYDGLTPLYIINDLSNYRNFRLRGSRQIVKHLLSFWDFLEVKVIKDQKIKNVLTTLYG